MYPLIFHPIFKERVWGGRELRALYSKPLPPGGIIGESWEISDRPGDASVIANGSLAGKDLRWLMENHTEELLGGARRAAAGRFPLLCKILDARQKLSLQVHPPAARAAELKGEPKTEMWFVADASPGATLYAGLKHGVTRAEFEEKIAAGKVAACFHRIGVRAGDAMFLPSGRVHAIGKDLVIFEIQQNSDTTYRVYDWDRLGLDGKPRELNVPESLASIDFQDFEPKLVDARFTHGQNFKSRALVRSPLFNVDEWRVEMFPYVRRPEPKLRIFAVVKGAARVAAGGDMGGVDLNAGQFCLVPACLKDLKIEMTRRTIVLSVEPN